MARRRHTSLRTSIEDIDAAKQAPSTAQTLSPTFRLAFADDDFLTSEDTRGVRFQLEYLKTEFRLREKGINSTVVLFGGARIPEPGSRPGRRATKCRSRTSRPLRATMMRRGASHSTPR
jgi:hypothetical protein